MAISFYDKPQSIFDDLDILATVYMDINLGGAPQGRVEFELFGDTPLTSENFRAICTGEKGFCQYYQPPIQPTQITNQIASQTNQLCVVDQMSSSTINLQQQQNEQPKKLLCYRNTLFHKIIPGFIIQGGDIHKNNGLGGESIYGLKFPDENFIHSHAERPGILSMSNLGNGTKNTNNSQFFITLDTFPHLDGHHVAFGRVSKGLEVLTGVSKVGSQSGVCKQQVWISDCGEINKDY
ncbi:Peptidyl-prolyl cis-trans isomerase [Oxytricha trifallax]|uniref:Peptidyl-prolyl cis-trans isomerase n=1 Tax=Oxytricha trifallax TaxID=1172189 RepID=A0A073IAK9_9SPIT|nr:Peptidyl-prolyl cis-trans isomerase [Oxytricha trifallax]